MSPRARALQWHLGTCHDQQAVKLIFLNIMYILSLLFEGFSSEGFRFADSREPMAALI